MTGYLFLKPDGSWRAVALGDMGMERFRFEGDPQQGAVVIKPDSFPEQPLIDGVIGDLQHLFGMRPGLTEYLVQREGAGFGLVMRYDDGNLEEYLFSSEGDLPVRSCGVSNGKIIRAVTYHDPTMYPGCARPLARRIVLHNHKWRYSLEIVLLDVRVTE